MEKEETKNLRGFCAMELVANLIFIGAFSIALSNHLGIFLRFDSLLMVASLGVILKMAKQEIKVASSAKMINAKTPAITTIGFKVKGRTLIE